MPGALIQNIGVDYIYHHHTHYNSVIEAILGFGQERKTADHALSQRRYRGCGQKTLNTRKTTTIYRPNPNI